MYEAVLTPTVWSGALLQLATCTDSKGATLEVFDRSAGFASGFVGGTVPDSVTFRKYYHQLDPLKATWNSSPEGKLILCHEHISAESVAKSPFYQEFYIPNGGRYRASWILEKSHGRVITLGLFRQKKSFDRSELDDWQCIADHCRQSVRLIVELNPLLARGAALKQALDRYQPIYLMVDKNGRILDCSAAASDLLTIGTPLTMSKNGQLGGSSVEETHQLRTLISDATSTGIGGAIRLSERSLVRVVPCAGVQQNPLDARLTNWAVVFLTPPAKPVSLDWQRVQSVLKCTRAEAEVALMLALGVTPTAIAQERNVSLNTIRTQIRMLLEKADLHKIVDLVRFISAIQ